MVRGEAPPPPERSGNPGPEPPADGNPPKPPGDEPVVAVCPECGGVLTERAEAGVLQWECRVGHRYSPNTLIDAQAEDVESALWAAIRALEDRAALLDRMAHQSEQRGQARSARRFRRQSHAASDQAEIVRRALAGAAGTTLRRVADADDEERAGELEGADPEEGAA
jgi:hypothetical protein